MSFQKTIIITGGAGFIGSHVVRLFVNKYPEYRIINLDNLTYAGNLENLKDIQDKPNYTFVKADIVDAEKMNEVFEEYQPDGTAIRDYIHVVDLAKAHVIALQRLLENKNTANYEVFNLGTGHGNSVLEAITAFEKVSGEKLNWAFAPRRAGDVIQAYADTTKANQVLGWKSELNIEDAMRDAWRWEVKLKNG